MTSDESATNRQIARTIREVGELLIQLADLLDSPHRQPGWCPVETPLGEARDGGREIEE